MKFRHYRLQNADATAASTGGGAPTLMTDGAQTTPAASTTAPADTTATAPVADAGATQQASTDDTGANTDGKTDETTVPPEKVVPEKYEFKQPEGASMDDEALGDFAAVA